MLFRVPFCTSLLYVPLNRVDVQAIAKKCTVRFEKTDELNLEDFFKDEEEIGYSEDNAEIKCYDLSVPGYIGLPRVYGQSIWPHGFVNRTVRYTPDPAAIPRSSLKPRDELQEQFWNDLEKALRTPGLVDFVANAKTGTGKTNAALWCIENIIQAPTLITVPTNYLKNQWLDRIRGVWGDDFFNDRVGVIQQDHMDYHGKLVCVGLAPSLAHRQYPLALRRYFGAIFFDEWHKIGAPSMSRILDKYPASVRGGFTATNRRDALLKVCTLHLGKPRVISKQTVVDPTVYEVGFAYEPSPNRPIFSDYHVIKIITMIHERNELLAEIIVDGYARNREIVAFSDNTTHLQILKRMVEQRGVPEEATGLLVGEYYDGSWRINRAGNRVKRKIKVTPEQEADIAARCNVIFATYGKFDTGGDIPRLNMGVECTPRSNLDQAIGRCQRPYAGKTSVEWWSIRDRFLMTNSPGADIFADPRKQPLKLLEEIAQNRYASFKRKNATVIRVS